MKKLFTIFSLLMTINLFGQVDTLFYNKLAFEYINRYREYHGIPRMEWSDEIYKKSKSWSNILLSENIELLSKSYTINSHHNPNLETLSENVNVMPIIGSNIKNKVDILKFSNSYLGLDTIENVYMMDIVICIYKWHNSPLHKKIMISNRDIGSISMSKGKAITRVYDVDLSIDLSVFVLNIGDKKMYYYFNRKYSNVK